MLRALKNRAGWLGPKSPWLPQSSNQLFPVLGRSGNKTASALHAQGGVKETEETG